MPEKASALIELLREALHRIEQDSKAHPDDLVAAELKAAMLLGIAELESVRARFDRLRAA